MSHQVVDKAIGNTITFIFITITKKLSFTI